MDQPVGRYPRRLDDDGEFCDDPACEECEDDWDDDWGDGDWAYEDDTGDRSDPPLIHPSQFAQNRPDHLTAARMHPAARFQTVRVGVLARVFAEFLSIVIWTVVVVLGFLLALVLYASPPQMLLVGLTLVPLVGETVLTAELGVTPGKYLVGLRVRTEGSVSATEPAQSGSGHGGDPALGTGAQSGKTADDVGSVGVGTSENGQTNPGLSRSIIRTFIIVAPFLPMYLRGTVSDVAFIVGCIWVAVLLVSIATDPLRRGLHDRIAGTTVIAKLPVSL